MTRAALLRCGRWGWESRGVLFGLVYMVTRFVFAVVTVLVRRGLSRDAELLALRHRVDQDQRSVQMGLPAHGAVAWAVVKVGGGRRFAGR